MEIFLKFSGREAINPPNPDLDPVPVFQSAPDGIAVRDPGDPAPELGGKARGGKCKKENEDGDLRRRSFHLLELHQDSMGSSTSITKKAPTQEGEGLHYFDLRSTKKRCQGIDSRLRHRNASKP